MGKDTSVFGTDGAPGAIPAFPATLTAASVAVPTKYKSSKNFLLIQTDVEENCSTDTAASIVTVDGTAAFPDPSSGYNFECSNLPGTLHISRSWFMLPESLGGTPVAPGAMVDLLLSSAGGTAQATGDVSMIVRSGK